MAQAGTHHTILSFPEVYLIKRPVPDITPHVILPHPA